MKKLCSVNVDLDPLTAYYKIHGLGDPPAKLRHTILNKALPRFRDLFRELGIPATFFVVGQELEGSEQAQAIARELVADGHEMGNHTYTHPYDLCELPPPVVESEIKQAHEVITRVVGAEHAPVGFRTPGYGINDRVLQVLADQGYSYDASMFPSPPYYAAKAAAMVGMLIRGRRSGAVMGNPWNLLCPADPYRPDMRRPWRRGQSPVVELPVAVMPWTRLPAIGTLLAVSPPGVRRRVLSWMEHRPLFNLELHGIDLADAIEDRIPTELAGRQPDLRVPFEEKRRIFAETFRELQQNLEFAPLKDVASRVQRDGAL